MTFKVSEMPLTQKMGNTGAAPSAARNWDFAYTWNSGGTTFCADFMNITDTASAAGSLLIDRQVGGVSRFSVNKSGIVTALGQGVFVGLNCGGTTEWIAGGWSLRTNNVKLGSTTLLSWTSGAANGTDDTSQARNAAGVCEVNNGTKGNVRYLMGGGTAVASAAALPLPTGSVFHVTGTTGITSITSTNFQSGVMITLIFDGVLTVTDGGNLKLAGNFTTTADDTLTLVYDGTNWYECCRSVN